MRPIHLALKDLRQFAKDYKMVLFALLMPIAFTYFMGTMFGGGGAAVDPVLVAWVDHDLSSASLAMAQTLSSYETLLLQPMSEAEAEGAVRAGKAAAAVITPYGVGRALQQGAPAEVRLLVAEAGGNDAQAATRALEAAVTRLAAASGAARLSTAESAAWRPFASEGDAQAHYEDALARAAGLWAELGVSLRVVAAAATDRSAPTGFHQASPGMLVQFTVFNLLSAAGVLVVERRSGALRRLLTTPITRAGIIAGKVLSAFTIIFAQGLILTGVGHLIFGVPYYSSPLATLAVVAGFGFCMAALGLLVGTLARSENAVLAACLILMFALSGLGGAWFPLEGASPTFAAIGHLVPSAWAMDGFHSILLRGVGLGGVLAPLGILLAYGLVFLGLAPWRFRFE